MHAFKDKNVIPIHLLIIIFPPPPQPPASPPKGARSLHGGTLQRMNQNHPQILEWVLVMDWRATHVNPLSRVLPPLNRRKMPWSTIHCGKHEQFAWQVGCSEFSISSSWISHTTVHHSLFKCRSECVWGGGGAGRGVNPGGRSQGKGIFEAVIFISILINCRSGLILTLKACCFVVFCRYLRFCFGYFSVYHIERYICVARMWRVRWTYFCPLVLTLFCRNKVNPCQAYLYLYFTLNLYFVTRQNVNSLYNVNIWFHTRRFILSLLASKII